MFYSMPSEAVEKPVDEVKADESGSGTDSDGDDDSPPDLEEQDSASLQQQSQVNISVVTQYTFKTSFSDLLSLIKIISICKYTLKTGLAVNKIVES